MFAYVGYADAAPASLGKLGSLWRKRTVNHSYAFRLQGLHNRNEIAVGGDENGHIVIVVPSQPHHVGCNGSIYTLSLGASHISAAVHALRDHPATRRAFWAWWPYVVFQSSLLSRPGLSEECSGPTCAGFAHLDC